MADLLRQLRKATPAQERVGKTKPQRFSRDPDGFLVDMERPIIEVIKGRKSSELGITVMASELGLEGDRWYNIPSIIKGVYVGDGKKARSDAKRRIKQGWEFPNFSTGPEAVEASKTRSKSLFGLREAAGQPTGL